MELFAALPQQLLEQVLPLYRDTLFAYSIAGAMTLAALLLLFWTIVKHLFQMSALRGSTDALQSSAQLVSQAAINVRGTSDQQAFTAKYEAIDTRLSRDLPFAGGIAEAWRQFKQGLQVVPERISLTPVEPRVYFGRVRRMGGELDFAATMFVAVGLLATFLGLVAALGFAADGMRAGDSLSMQTAVRDLLAASASKFVTSVAGIGLSIFLRLADRIMEGRFIRALSELINRLDCSVRTIPGLGIDDLGLPPRPAVTVAQLHG
jgi:hypothetical protein